MWWFPDEVEHLEALAELVSRRFHRAQHVDRGPAVRRGLTLAHHTKPVGF